MNTRNARWTGLIAGVLIALGSHAALAQPTGPGFGPGPGYGHGYGHGPGFGQGAGPHGPGMSIEGALASVKGQLNLTQPQETMWNNAVAAATAARDAGRTSMQQVHATLIAELAKAEPNFAAVAAAGDAAQANMQTLRKQVRDQWLALYNSLSSAQKTLVRDAVKARVDRMESFRARMQERAQVGAPATR
jgi:hypothetical protein